MSFHKSTTLFFGIDQDIPRDSEDNFIFPDAQFCDMAYGDNSRDGWKDAIAVRDSVQNVNDYYEDDDCQLYKIPEAKQEWIELFKLHYPDASPQWYIATMGG